MSTQDEINKDNYIDILQSMFSRIKTNMGLNHKDPVLAHMTHFNTRSPFMGVDPARATRSHVFITRPDCNMGYLDNFYESPELLYYANTSMGRTLLNLLQYPSHNGKVTGEHIPRNHQVGSWLNPLLSNACRSVSGAKDLIMEKVDSKPDFTGNFTSYAVGADGMNSPGEVTLDFDNPMGSPVLHYFIAWFMYIHHAAKGSISPELKYIINRQLDYTVSIYVFVLGPDNQTIERYVKYTGCYPISVPFGDIQHNKEMDPGALSKVSISFAYNRYEPMNPEIFEDFHYITYPTVAKQTYGDPRYYWKNKIRSRADVRENVLPEQDIKDPLPTRADGDEMMVKDSEHRDVPADLYTTPVMSISPFILGNKLLFV